MTTTAHVSFQDGKFPLDKFFDDPRFTFVLAFSDSGRDNGTTLRTKTDFYDDENNGTNYIPLRSLVTSKTIDDDAITGARTYTYTFDVSNTSGGLLAPSTVGLMIFASFEDADTNWLTNHSMSLNGPRTEGTITGPSELNWDWLLSPNLFRINSGTDPAIGTLLSADSYSVTAGTVTVNFDVALSGTDDPLDILPVGFELAVIETNSRSWADTTSNTVTVVLRAANFTEVVYS